MFPTCFCTMPSTRLRNSSLCRPITLSGNSQGKLNNASWVGIGRSHHRSALQPLAQLREAARDPVPVRTGTSAPDWLTVYAYYRQHVARGGADPGLLGASQFTHRDTAH